MTRRAGGANSDVVGGTLRQRDSLASLASTTSYPRRFVALWRMPRDIFSPISRMLGGDTSIRKHFVRTPQHPPKQPLRTLFPLPKRANVLPSMNQALMAFLQTSQGGVRTFAK